MDSKIALVDEQDNIVGYADKIDAHRSGALHRAFSIFIFNNQGEMLIHRRSPSKYHSPNLWTNACCSHLTAGRTMEEIIHYRLQAEMGFDCELKYLFSFRYKTKIDNEMFEHEIDWVYRGIFNNQPKLNSEEADSYQWIKIEDLLIEIESQPLKFTYWFKYIISNYLDKIVST